MQKSQPEYDLQRQVCEYLSYQYKDVLFMSDTIASVKLTVPQALRNKKIQKTGFKCPDLILLEPRNGYAGLMMELKAKSPYLESGKLTTKKHVQDQNKDLVRLRAKGYIAEFAWDFATIKKMLDGYLN